MKTHIVQPGEENLEIIAKKYNLNPGDLAIYNRIANNDNLVPGQEIKLELPKDAKPIVVRLGKNDTLETVAKQFNTSVDRLMALNNLPNTNVSEGATLVAWDPFRMNYTNISKAEDLDTLAKQLNTSKDLLLKSNPHVDPNDIKPNTSLFVPWQLNRYVEPPKETKTYSPPKEAPKEEPVDEVPPKTEPLKVDKVPAYAGEKEGEFLLKNYYDHHVFLTEKPTMKPSNWWDKLWGFNDLYREREKEKYIKDITDELLKATNDAFKAYKKAEKEGDRYEMQKQLTWIDNTHKEFERITGIKKGFDPAVVVKDIMRPEARIAEEEANKMEKELALLRAKETDIAGLPESVLSDDEALLDYSTDTFKNLNDVQTEGIEKRYIVRKDIDPKTVNPESIDAIINYSGFSLTDKAKSMLDDFKKANDIPYDISKLSENLTKYFGEFNTDISNALYEQDYNKRVKNQKEFLRKYEDLAIVHEQINPNFLKYNQLYLDYSDLNNKIENILLDLKSINNSDIILEALTSGNLEAYKERLDSLGIKQSDIAKVGNLLSEYEAYSDKIVAIQSGFSQINQDLENDLELFTKALNNFDTNLNIKEFFISEANPTSEFGKSIKSLATLSFEASKLRGSTIEDNKRLVEFQDFLNWYQSYVEAATSNFNAISLLNIRNDMWQNISGLTEQRKSEAKNFANWFNPKYNDITFGERAYTTFVESLVNLTKVPVVGDVAEKVFSALDWYNNVALVEYVFPVAKTYRSTVDMAGWLLPRKLELEANLLVGNYSEEEKERQRREFEEKFQQQAETRFGLKDYDLRNIDLVWSHFATGSLEKKVIPIYDSNGNMMKDSNGNIMTSEIFYNKIRLQRDWDLFEVLKKGNRLDLLQDIRDLNEGKDLRNLKAGDYINLPKLDYGSRGPLIRGGEDFWWSPQDYFENAITNPTATEGVNQLVEIFLDPGTYILKSPYALAKGSIVSPIKFLTGKNIKGLSAITNEALIAGHKALEHNFSFPTFEKFFPKIQDLHASWNKKVIEGIEAFAPKEKKATSWWQIPAQIDAIQGKTLNIVKSYPVSRLAIEGISNTIDLFSKPVDQFSFKLLTEANSSVLNIFDNFKLDYLSDHVPTTKTVFNKIKEHQVVSVNLSSGKKIVGVVNRAPSGAGLRGSIRTKGKDIILDSNSFDVKLKDGTVVTVYEKNVSDIFTFNSKEVREMTTSWKKTNPKEKYFYDTIKYNLPGIKVNKVNTFNLKKGDYIVSGQDIGSVVSVKDNKVKIKTFDNNENLIEKEIIPTKEVSLIDEEYIKNLNFNWKNAYANTLLPLKKVLAVTTGGIQWFIDYLALGTLLNRLPFELRARANNLINKATATLIAKSSLSATEIWKYFADAFEDSQRRYLLTRKLRIDNKWVELKWNEVWNSKTKKIEVVENPDKKFVLEEKFRSLLLEPGGASLDDWKILSKYNVYPSDIYKAIQKLLTRLSRGDEVANLLKQKSDLINDLIKVLDVNNLNLEGRRISSHFNEDWNKYLIKKGITSRKVREDIVHAANDFGKKIANIDDENLISTARNEIKQIYGEFVSKEAEAVWNIYKEYVSDLLEKQKTQIDSVIVDLPAGVDITFESVEKKLGRLDEIVFQKRTFVNRGGEPVYVFEPGAKKADMIEAIGRLSYEEKLLQVNEKILEGFNVAKIIEDFYEDAFIGNKKTYKLYKDYLAVNKKAELPDFIAWVDTYQSLKRSDFSSYKLLKDTISKQIKGSSPSDKLRLELMELLDSKFPLLRTHDYTKTVDTLLNAKRMSDKAFSDAAKVLDHYLNKRRHPVVLSNKKFMVIDTETTGLNVAKDDAFQFSWKIIDGDGKVIDTHNYYRAFDSKFTEAKFLSEDALKAQKVHGITIEKLKESNPKDIKEIINAFAESISSVDSIIAHNSDFDIEFIKKAIEEVDGSPDAIFRGIDIIDTNKRNVIDKGWEGGKLDDLYRKYMGGSLVGAHNALKDVDALIDIYKKALREGKLNERIFKSQEKNIYNNLVKLRDQLDVFQKRIELPVGIGKQFNFVATKTLTPERIKVIREEVARNLFNQESERLFNLSTEDIVKELSIPGAISKAIKDGQVAHSPRKNIIGDFKDKNIRDILFFNQDKFKEIDSKIKKINKDLEKGKLTSVEKKKLIKELDTLNFEKSQYDPIKNNLPENSGIRVIGEDYVPDEKELADLKKLIDDGWRFVVYSKSRSRLSNDPPAVKLLRSLGLAEEYQMKSPEAAGKLFDFYVYNTKSNKLLSRDLVGITSEYVDEYTTVPGILGILYRSTDSKEYIVSLYKKLSKKLKTVDPEEDITKVINSSYFFDTIYNFVIRNKNIFKGKEFEEFLPRFRFLKNLRKAKSSPDVSILMINSIENLKLNNVNVDVVLLGKLNKEQLKAVNHFNDVIEMEELNLSPNIRLEDKINKTREIKKYNDEISIKLEAEDKVAYPKIELTNEDLNAVKKIIDDVSSKVFDDLTLLKKFVKNQDIDIEKSLIDGENISIESYVNKLFKETEEDYRALRFSEFEITKKGSEEEPLAGSSGDLIKHTFDRWIDDQLDILNIVSYEDLDTIKSLMKSIGAKEQIRENFQGKKVSVYEISLNDAYYYRVKGLDPNALIHKPKVTKKEYLNVKTSYIVPGVYGGKTVNFVFGDGSFIIKGHYGHFKNVDNKIVYSIDTSPENIKKLDLKDGDIIYTNTTMAENFKKFNATDAIFPVKVKEYNRDYLDEPSNIVDLTRGSKDNVYDLYIIKDGKLKEIKSKIDKDNLTELIEKNIDTEKKSYYLLDDVGWRNDKYSDVSFIVEEMPSLDLPNQHSEVIVPKRATITETIEVKEEFPDSFAIKKEDGTSMFIEGNTKTKINNIIFKSKSTGDYSLFFPPKFLFDFDKIDLDRTRLIKKLLPEDSPKTDYIVIDVPNNSYINKLKKDLDTLDLDALKKYDLEKDIEKAIKERDSADAFEKVIKETDELKGIKIYRISSIEGIALEENLESINKFRDSRFNKENGLFISSNPDKTKDFLDFKLFTPRESKILENMNNVFTEIKDLVRSEKLHGKSAFYTKQFSIFSEPVNLDKSIESLVRNIERGAAVDDLEKVILETVTKTKRAWDGKNVVVIALDDATSLTGEFYEAINDIIEKNKRLKTKTKILFPDHPNLLERDAKAYLLSRGFDENLIGVVDLDHVPVAKTYKDFKITDQTKAIKDLINLQNEKMSRASYSLVIGKIEDDVAGIIPKRLLLAQNSKEAGILVMSDNLILKDQINVMKGFLVENTDSAYKFPSAGIRDELFNKKITFQRALEKTIIASSRKEFQKEWVKFINEETNAYRETVESQYKPYLAGGSNIELELYREMVEEQVQRFRDAFKPIEKYILKWDGSEPVLDKYLRSARERVLKDLINDIAEGKRDRAIFENYLEKGDVPTVGYFLRKNLGYNTTKFLIALPGYLQTIFIQSVLRLMPRWSINNALDDLIKTLIFDRDFKKFLSGIWLQGKIFVNFYGTLLKHGKIDVSNSIMSNFFRLQKKLGIINNKEFNLKIRKLPKKGFYDLSELLKEWGHEDWSKMIRYIDDITIVKKDKKGKSILDKEGREVSQTYSAIDLDYMMSTGIQEIYSSPEEALLYFKRIIPKNANPLERIGFKAKEWNANLDMFYSQTERLRRAIALQRALQDQTIDMAKAKAFVSDFFFDYKAVNRAGVFFRKFFPFFTFSYFTARLYLKLLLGRYGYQTFRAGVAIMQIWEANTAHLPEMYKDRISIKIGDREFLIRPNISLIDVMRFVFDPSKEIEQTFENPRKLFFGLGYGPIVGPIVEELTGATYFKPSESEMKAMGWNYGEIKKELQKYEDSKAGETWIDTWWKLVYSIVPHIEIIEKLFFKADVEFQQTGNILKSSKFREISKMFAINILERDAVDAFTQKLYSLPPSVRNYYINQIKESDPELYEEWQRQSLISLNNNLIVKGVSEEERIRTLDKRRAQNEYYRLEAQEKGAGSEWLDKNPYQKELLEEVWRDSPKSAYDEYREKLRLIDEDRRTIRQIVEETLPSNLENEKNIERYKALGYDYQPVNRDKLIKDLTNKDLNIHQMNVLLAYKYPDVGLDFIRKSQIDQKRAESEEYKALSLEEKKELSLADQAYYKKINILNRFLPDKDATEEEVQKAFELRKKQIDKIFTPEEKKRYLDSIPESQKILEKAMTDYIERWGKIIENSEGGKYWESLNSQPSWFKEFYFLNNPEVRVYLPLALEREKRLGEVIEMEKRGFSTIKERKALNDWFWAHEKEIKAWESHSPETIERYRERKEYDENFYFPLQSFANIKNWQGYYNFLLSPSNKKYLDMWSRMGSSERTEEQIKEEAEQKIKMAKLSKEYYSLPSTTWNDQKKKQEWLNNNSELRDWWDRNKSKEELELSKKAQVYFDMKFDIEDEGSGYDYYLKFREINVKRQDYLNNNPDVLKYINSNEEGTLLEPSTIKRKLAIYNTLSDEKKREYLDNNKDLAKYFLDGVPSGIRKVRELQEEYFNIKESQFKTKDEFYDARNKFLKDNPNLKKYWDAMAMPSSYFLDKQKFNKYQIDLSKVLKYYDSISANNLSDSMRISLLNMNSYMVPGNSEEDKWMMNKVYESAMQTWIRLLDENKSVGMYFFRQLPTWIRARYYDNHPDKRVLSNYSLNQWFGQPIWRYNKNNPSVNWALEQQRKYGKNIPISIKRQVEKILIGAGEWEDRSSWTSEKWKEWQTDRAARLNGLKQKDVDTNPLLRKELYRATVFFKRNAPIDPKIYNKKIKFMNLPDNSVFLL